MPIHTNLHFNGFISCSNLKNGQELQGNIKSTNGPQSHVYQGGQHRYFWCQSRVTKAKGTEKSL